MNMKKYIKTKTCKKNKNIFDQFLEALVLNDTSHTLGAENLLCSATQK